MYLDIFHAIQRITRKISKRHPFQYQCVRDLQLVFRDPLDQGSVRTKPTPEPEIMQKHLHEFEQKWQSVSYNDEFALPSAALREIQCLCVHVSKGCLSGTYPGRGTNRNERLHKELNSLLTNSRYGVELAYAFLTSIFFKHNENICAKRVGRHVTPINAKHLSNVATCELYGLCTQSSIPQTGFISPSLSVAKVHMN